MDVYFDIETGALEDSPVIAAKMKAVEPDRRLKDPIKIEADVKAKCNKIMEGAALSALTGEIVAIGYMEARPIEGTFSDPKTDTILDHPEGETALLINFWKMFQSVEVTRMIGFNIKGFDLPFLIRRSWANKIQVPQGVMDGRYFSRRFVDLRETWACGEYGASGKLDDICKALSLPGKTGDHGAEFAKMLCSGDGELVDQAIMYLKQDVKCLHGLAGRMGMF